MPLSILVGTINRTLNSILLDLMPDVTLLVVARNELLDVGLGLLLLFEGGGVHLALRIGADIWEGLTGFGDEEAGRAVEGDGWDAGWELGRGNGSHAAWADGDGAFGADVVHVGHDEGPEGIEELHFSYWDSESVMTLRMEKKGKDEGIAHYMGVNAVRVLDQAI